MNFDITTTEWQQVENLTDDTTYVLQAKTISESFFYKSYSDINILFEQGTSLPTDAKTGIMASAIKFKKVSGINIYVKCLGTPTNIDIQEVQ